MFLNWDKPNEETPYFWRNWLYRWIRRPNVFYSMCNFCAATTVENGWFLRKTAFYNRKVYILRGWAWGLKIFGPKFQKAPPYAKSGRINRLVYVAVAVFWRYTAPRKKVNQNAHRNFESSTLCVKGRPTILFVHLVEEHLGVVMMCYFRRMSL